MLSKKLLPVVGEILLDSLSVLGCPTNTVGRWIHTLMEKKTQEGRDILLEQISMATTHPSDPEHQDELISIIYRYGMAIRDNVARRNLCLLAQAIRGMLNQRAIYADDFSRYAEALSQLSRDEIIVLGTLHSCKLEKRQSLGRPPTYPNIGTIVLPS
jgi:hypothetical protein